MVVKGGAALSGEVNVSGSKNSALPILFSTLLAEGEHVLTNVPDLKDIESAGHLLTNLGCEVTYDRPMIRIRVPARTNTEAPYDIVRKMRASILVLGPLLARYGKAKVSLPGGCAIGTRPINLHLEGLESLGASLRVDQGYVNGESKRLQGGEILLDSPSVGATENLMMAAALSDGITVLENAAKEPEIVDLAEYLNRMGAKISGAGGSVIRIQGVDQLRPAEHAIIPDRIEAGTLLIAGAITGGEVVVKRCVSAHLGALIDKLRESGFQIETSADSIALSPNKSWAGVDVTTAPHPGFPTDLQAQFMSLMSVAEGLSVISETVFENRFMHVQELARLNADITQKTHVAVVRGHPGGLQGAPVMATDLRASASLVLAGLAASGETTVNRIYHLDRGYENLEGKLSRLGAQIKRIP